ncbi:hypothetical protein LTR10_023873 [Elasticomyces elasticus]|uniref:FAD dependent oxidoreductase domain-containing protein n=1 Tax=Exophiala sideris TaxID=1016849 RepID=A0ABR0IUY6_9EURO|nr:hypothetical protein LTR10_023873 [Elasticomyces elasticus]KAK5021249.1 hypothetical protein LTS07_011164 [Exophiala sideris]KAK5030194.1 hypothetical protein LTR13_008212 [Exophiala sideris]KAK5049148.1 hypothetical protein LTR69_011175 [Exophiala sideris]KAK5176424.1 hypothetical protein LTR44_011046 [Eurotiomycetes sp. CCFEE 6388]
MELPFIQDPNTSRQLPEQVLPCSTASYDTGRIIRDDYIHPTYRTIATAAMHQWQNAEPWCRTYRRSGLVLVEDSDNNGPLKETYNLTRRELESNGASSLVEELYCRDDIKKACGGLCDTGNWGYLTHKAGWVDAGDIMNTLLKDLKQSENIHFECGRVKSLVKDETGDVVVGILLESGQRLVADLVVLATGPWTSALADTRGKTVSAGEAVAYVQLQPEDGEIFRKMPAFLNFEQKICLTPPSRQLFRIALHRDDWVNTSNIDHPEVGRTDISIPPERGLGPNPSQRVSHERQLRGALQRISPLLASRPIVHFGYCWYDDTLTGDFIVSYHPDYQGSLFMLHGLGGHGFKFLPVLGQYAVATVLEELDPRVKNMWKYPEDVDHDRLRRDHGQGGWR